MTVPPPVTFGCLFGVLAVLYHYDLLFTTFTICVHLAVGTLGIYLGVSWALIRGKQYTPPEVPKELKHPHISMVLQNMMEARAVYKQTPQNVIISRNMDLELQDVIDLLLRDFILTWYKDLSVDRDSLQAHLQLDLWKVIEKVSDRLTKIDTVQFITQDVVNKLIQHFQDIRLATRKGPSEEPVQKFVLHPWLLSEEKELNFLRKVSEALLLVFLPDYYSKSPPIRHLLREVLANAVLKPSIDLICDPDYINMQLLSYIEYREKLSEDTRITYTYAATYEDFVKMIDKYEDIEHLKQLRFNIMTEIMQATTINNFKKSNFPDKPGTSKGERRQSTAKGELLKQRNLKRYINQLTVAKSRCEKRIFKLGGPDYKYYTGETQEGSKQSSTLPGHKVMPFKEIMSSAIGREYFESFLQRDSNESLLGFWNAVKNLKEADKKQHHNMGADIYQRFISSSTSVVKVDKSLAKKMETFMLGDSGPEAFYEAQEQVYKVLERQHYPSFLVSDIFHKYVTLIEEQGGEATGASGKDELFFEPKEGLTDDEEDEMFSAQSYHAKQKLQQLTTKITNKTQALDALRASGKPDAKMLKVQEELQGVINDVEEERRRLDAHIRRTEQWCENVGKWTAHIYEAEIQNEGDKKVPVFVLVIHLSGSSSQNLQSSTQGWVVNRKLQDFYAVHEKLVQIEPWLKNKDLPKIRAFTTVDQKFLNEAKALLNEYLKVIMRDLRLSDSQALYGFLTPTPEYFQQPGQEKKSGFFLRNLFRNLPSIGQDSRDTDEELLFSSEDKTEDRSKDSIAEPLYSLISEVYELHGMFKWLRKSFISFVEVTFGRSINRQLRETIYWIFSEPMIIYYIRNFKESMWPHGVLAPSLPPRSDEEKLRTRLKAKEKFLQIQPDAVKTLVGEENKRRGTIKMFEVLQDTRLNKQLFYGMLLLLIQHVVPELGAMLSQVEDMEDSTDVPVIIGSDQ
ncbi:sorting nexin-25-like [Ruditapes philippinarum]|uniref:sorting nexin-25-like n=1 Tax=Ruditapes philippinarum TaxID=129788 RepID=UPI00295A8C2D|nr:sorting nexin-25-like [Ruditapes philippinarum]